MAHMVKGKRLVHDCTEAWLGVCFWLDGAVYLDTLAQEEPAAQDLSSVEFSDSPCGWIPYRIQDGSSSTPSSALTEIDLSKWPLVLFGFRRLEFHFPRYGSIGNVSVRLRAVLHQRL